MDDIASDMLEIHPADYTPDGATALTLRAVEAMVDDGAVPPALRKAFLSVRERVVMTYKDQKLDTEVLIRTSLDWMSEKDKKAILQGAASELERTLEHRSKDVKYDCYSPQPVLSRSTQISSQENGRKAA